MSDGSVDLSSTRDAIYAAPLESLDPAQPALFQADTVWPIFERLRREDPVHFTEGGGNTTTRSVSLRRNGTTRPLCRAKARRCAPPRPSPAIPVRRRSRARAALSVVFERD